MKSKIIYWLMLLLPQLLWGQVDVSKYSTEDLFKVKPIFNTESIEDEKNSDSNNSFFEIEIEKGLMLWQSNQLDDALDYFNLMIEDYHDIPILHYYIGNIFFEKKEYQEAITSFWKVLKIEPLFLEAKYMIGLSHLELRQRNEALDIMKQLENIPVYATYGYHGQGLIYQSEGNLPKAINFYKKSIKTDSSFLESYIPLISLEMRYTNNYKNAKNLVDQALRIDSTWQQARIIRVILVSLVDKKGTNQIDSDINILLKQDPNNYHYYTVRGLLDVDMKNYRAAFINFRKAYNLEVDSTFSGEYKFSTKIKRNVNLRLAMNYYHEHYDEIDSNASNFIDEAICYNIANENRNDFSLLDSALNYTNHAVIFTLIGVFQESASSFNWKTVIDQYTEAIKRDSLNMLAYQRRGELYMNYDMTENAINDFTTLIKINVRNKMGHKNRGILKFQEKNYSHAYRDFTSAIILDSTDSDLFFNRSTCTYYLKYYDSSIKDIQQVLKLKKNDGDAYYMWFLNLLQKGDTLNAISILDSASKYQKYNKDYHLMLIGFSTKFNLKETCIAGHDRLVRYFSHTNQYRLNRGIQFYEYGQLEKAKKDFEYVLERNKNSGEAYFYLGKILKDIGDEKGGVKAIDKAKKLGYPK